VSTSPVRYERITKTWAFLFGAISLVVAILLNETIAHGRGKSLFFVIFMAGCAIKTAQKLLNENKILVFLLFIILLHILLVFIAPTDDRYPGGLLFPAAILDYTIFYLVFQRIAKDL
jgi:hypothetical protein